MTNETNTNEVTTQPSAQEYVDICRTGDAKAAREYMVGHFGDPAEEGFNHDGAMALAEEATALVAEQFAEEEAAKAADTETETPNDASSNEGAVDTAAEESTSN